MGDGDDISGIAILSGDKSRKQAPLTKIFILCKYYVGSSSTGVCGE